MWRIARVTQFNRSPTSRTREIDLIKVTEERNGIFILVDWIIRVMYMAPAHLQDHPRDYVVLDTFEADMYLRLQAIKDIRD
jgi:hypothetical protein